MALNLPQSLTLFKPRDPDAQRYLSPIERTITSILRFANSSFDLGINGSLKVIRTLAAAQASIDNLTSNSSFTSNGTATLAGTNNVTGPLNASGVTTTTGVTNINGGLNTPTGVKTVLGAWSMGGTSVTAAGIYNLQLPNFQNGAVFTCPFGGSFVGAAMLCYSNVAMTVSTYANGVYPSEYKYDWSVAASTSAQIQFSVARGTKTFFLNNQLIFKVQPSVAATGFYFVYMPIVEFNT